MEGKTMGLIDWIKRITTDQPNVAERQGLTDIVGSATDENGRAVPIYKGPLRRVSLTTNQVSRIVRLKRLLAEANPIPMSIEGWIDGFLRDMNPENEIQILEAVASVYVLLTAGADLSLEEKRTLYRILCVISAGASSPELTDVLPRREGIPPLAGVITMYQKAREVIAYIEND